MCGNSVKGGEG